MALFIVIPDVNYIFHILDCLFHYNQVIQNMFGILIHFNDFFIDRDHVLLIFKELDQMALSQYGSELILRHVVSRNHSLDDYLHWLLQVTSQHKGLPSLGKEVQRVDFIVVVSFISHVSYK